MDAITVFVAEVLFCLSLSALILFRLHRLLRGVGTEVCERVEQLKSSLSLVLIGQFIGLALVGRSVWKSIPKPTPEKPAAPTIAPKLAEAA